jgi:MYXO-CTERM domain-containing protein
MGASYASNAIGTAALGGIPNANTGMDGSVNNTRLMNTEGNLMNGTTGTMNPHESIMRDKIRTGENYNRNNYNTENYTRDNYNRNTVTPLGNTAPDGKYRATSTTTNTGTTSRGSNWGWLGLFGLLGLVGMRSRSDERR